MIRPQAVVLPLLRAALPGVSVVSVVPDVDQRTYPMIALRRAGGARHPDLPTRFALPELELEAVSAESQIHAEELYEDALDALYAAVAAQDVVPGVGYLHSVSEDQGATQAKSPYPDTWAVEGTIRLGLRAV